MGDPAVRSSDRPELLVVEDNPGDARLVEEAFGDARPGAMLHVVSSGPEALDFVHQRGQYATAPRPNLVLLDWKLGGMSGAEVLSELKADTGLCDIPVVVLTGSKNERDIAEAYANRANACIQKAGDPESYTETLDAFAEFWLSAARLPRPVDEE